MATPAPQTELDSIPERLGRYHVLGLAGRGNMAVVYTGYDPYSERDVAIKVCAPQAQGTGKRVSESLARKLFYNEAHTAGILDHPNILRVLDAGEHDDQLYLVMEYVDGGETLAPFCKPSNMLPVRKVAEVVYTSAQALDYAHRQGVIHRDIKPTNILFTPDGGLKIGDFGIAQSVVEQNTEPLGVMGTPHFMSPEQIAQGKLSGQTDVYSLGVLMFQLLSGRLPFTGENLNGLLYNICHGKPAPLRSLRPDLPEALVRVVEWAMFRDVSQRYSSARELARDIAEIFSDLDLPQDTVDEDSRFVAARDLRFFSDFEESDLWEMVRACSWQTHEAGEEILTEGSLDMSLFVIVSGDVEVRKGGRTVGELRQGDCFGELSYLGRREHAAATRAKRDVTLMKIGTVEMEQSSVTAQLQFHKAFVRILVERLSRPRDDHAARADHAQEAPADYPDAGNGEPTLI